jgi:RNA polymerase sigma-70 factor (sigma-E family)
MPTRQGGVSRDEDFSEYVDARWPSLVRSALLLGCTRTEAEDLVQTTLLRCYTRWPRVQRATDRDAYVYRVLVNCRNDSRRRFWWNERPTGQLPERTAPDQGVDFEQADAVRRALAGLSEANRTAVVLRYYAGLTEAEIAETLGIRPGTVKSRISRGLAQLGTDDQLTDLHDGTAS